MSTTSQSTYAGKLAAAVRPVFERAAVRDHVPGIAYGVVLNGALAHTGGVGSLRDRTARVPGPSSRSRICSMTKSFVAAAALMLRDAGKLRLDDPIADYVPQAGTLTPPAGDSPVLTVRGLMSMAGGLPEDDAWADRQLELSHAQIGRMLAGGASFTRPPGTEYEYSNLGWVLLGWAVSNLVGARVQDFICGELLGPLGLTSTGWDLPAGDDVMTGHRWRDGEWLEEEPPLRDGDFAVMGGLWSTVRDLSRWMTFFMDAFPPRDDADTLPLSRASRREMQQVHRAWQSALAQQNGRLNAGGYGFGLMVTHDLRFGHIVGHPGGLPGYGSHMRWLPDRGVGVVALGNLTYAPMGLATLEALEALDDAALIPPRAVPLSPDLVRARDGLVRLVRRWDDGLADELFAGNVFLDYDRDHRREHLARLRDRLGEFRAGDLTADGALRGRFTLMGGELSAAVTMMLSPEVPARIMSYDLSVEGEGGERGH